MTPLRRSEIKRSRKRLTPEYAARRREVLQRDGECQFSDNIVNCHVPAARCDVHHILRLSWGGTNELDNLVTLCRGPGTPDHHTYVHENRPEAEKLGFLQPKGAPGNV